MPHRLRAYRFSLLAAMLLAVALLIAAGVLWGTQRFISDAARVSHSNEVIVDIEATQKGMQESVSAVRAYLLLGDVDDLSDFRSRRRALEPALAALVDKVADNPAQQRRALQLQAQIHQRLERGEVIVSRYQEGGLAAVGPTILHSAREQARAIDQAAAAMVAAERELLKQRAANTEASATMLRLAALLGIPAGLSIVAVMYRSLLREIRRRGHAERASVSINARLSATVAQLERSGTDQRELNRFGSLLQSCVDADEAVHLAAQLISRLLPGSGGTLYRMRESRDYVEEVAHWGEHAAPSTAMVGPGQCWALRRGLPHIMRAGHELTRCPHISDPDITVSLSTACLPVMAQGSQLGMIYLSAPNDAFLERLELVESVAEHLALALHNLQLQQTLHLQSIRDPLTGLFNRRYLEESLPREISRCQRRAQPLAVMMLDVDHFKAFNDVHGHAGGDAVLARFGQMMLQLIRSEDIVCRYGGEEFTVILPETDASGALDRAERIRAGVQAMHVEHMGRELPRLTVSIGIALYPQHADGAEGLLRMADEALYKAKRDGRNRVLLPDTHGLRVIARS